MIHKYIDLSTAHLTQATADRLWSGTDAPLTVWPDPHPHDAASCFVYVPDGGSAGVEDCPPDLARCIDFARSLGCDRILFDRDGDTHEALPTYEEQEANAATTTADVGLLIRDMIEDIDMERIDLTGNTPNVIGTDHVDCVDVSDPHNPRVLMASGAVFRVTIVREG